MKNDANKIISKLGKSFVFTCGIILCLTALAKIFSAQGDQLLLQQPDPLLGISFRYAYFATSSLELFVCICCFFKTEKLLSAVLVAWLSTMFLAYRVGLWLINWHRRCHCLGNFSTALHISDRSASTLMQILLGFMLIGSYAIVLWKLLERRSFFQKFSLSSGHYMLNANWL